MKGRDTVRGHVMFVTSGLERGGAERQLVIVANALAARGWRVTVLSYLPFSDVSLRAEVDESRVRLVSLNVRGSVGKLAGVARAVAVVRRARPDVLVGFMFHGMMTARIAGRLAGVPAVVSAVRSEAHGRARERALGATGWMTDAVTVMSDSLASHIAERGVALLRGSSSSRTRWTSTATPRAAAASGRGGSWASGRRVPVAGGGQAGAGEGLPRSAEGVRGARGAAAGEAADRRRWAAAGRAGGPGRRAGAGQDVSGC